MNEHEAQISTSQSPETPIKGLDHTAILHQAESEHIINSAPVLPTTTKSEKHMDIKQVPVQEQTDSSESNPFSHFKIENIPPQEKSDENSNGLENHRRIDEEALSTTTEESPAHINTPTEYNNENIIEREPHKQEPSLTIEDSETLTRAPAISMEQPEITDEISKETFENIELPDSQSGSLEIFKNAQEFIQKFKALIPALGAIMLFAPAASEAGQNKAAEFLSKKHGIELASKLEMAKHIFPKNVTAENINGKEFQKMEVTIKGSDEVKKYFIASHPNWTEQSNDVLFDKGLGEYQQFKENLKNDCPDVSTQKIIIKEIALHLQEAYGNPTEEIYIPKIGTQEANNTTFDNWSTDASEHLLKINNAISKLPQDHYLKIMNNSNILINSTTEKALNLSLNGTRNEISDSTEANPSLVKE